MEFTFWGFFLEYENIYIILSWCFNWKSNLSQKADIVVIYMITS